MEKISTVLLVGSVLLLIVEYVLFRSMSPLYFTRGPFATAATFVSKGGAAEVLSELEKRRDEGTLYLRLAGRSALVAYRPTVKLWFFQEKFPTQRIALKLPEGEAVGMVRAEVRPLYSGFLFPLTLSLYMVFSVVFPNEYAGIGMKSFGVLVACLIGLAIMLPFRPRADTLQIVKQDAGLSEALR